MTYQNALRLADQTIMQLRRHQYTRAIWVTDQGEITRTPNTDEAMVVMLSSNAMLAGVFGPDVQRQHLAEAIIETVKEG